MRSCGTTLMSGRAAGCLKKGPSTDHAHYAHRAAWSIKDHPSSLSLRTCLCTRTRFLLPVDPQTHHHRSFHYSSSAVLELLERGPCGTRSVEVGNVGDEASRRTHWTLTAHVAPFLRIVSRLVLLQPSQPLPPPLGVGARMLLVPAFLLLVLTSRFTTVGIKKIFQLGDCFYSFSSNHRTCRICFVVTLAVTRLGFFFSRNDGVAKMPGYRARRRQPDTRAPRIQGPSCVCPAAGSTPRNNKAAERKSKDREAAEA